MDWARLRCDISPIQKLITDKQSERAICKRERERCNRMLQKRGVIVCYKKLMYIDWVIDIHLLLRVHVAIKVIYVTAIK